VDSLLGYFFLSIQHPLSHLLIAIPQLVIFPHLCSIVLIFLRVLSKLLCSFTGYAFFLLFYTFQHFVSYYIVFNSQNYNFLTRSTYFLSARSIRIDAFDLASNRCKAGRTLLPTFSRSCNGQRARSHLG